LRFLIDNALPPRLAELLVSLGYDAIHVRAYGMQAASDQAILTRARAREEDRIVVSAKDYVGMLLPVLPLLEPELATGCVAVFRRGRLRMRRLPLSA